MRARVIPLVSQRLWKLEIKSGGGIEFKVVKSHLDTYSSIANEITPIPMERDT